MTEKDSLSNAIALIDIAKKIMFDIKPASMQNKFYTDSSLHIVKNKGHLLYILMKY